MRRMQILLPDELAEELDKVVMNRGKSRFIAEAVEDKLRQIRFAKIVDEISIAPAWKDADHPELKDGSAAYIDKLRKNDDTRNK